MEETKRDEIIDDLLTLRPKGLPAENAEYEEYTEWCYQARKDKKRVRCNHPHWGYDPDTLFGLGFKRQGQVETYLSNRFFGKETYSLKKGQKSGVTRKTNRIWTRISDAVSKVETEGRPGIYTITKRWSSDALATVWAEGHDEANTMGKMFYGHVIPDGAELRTNFVRIGPAAEVIPVNIDAVAKLRDSIESSKNRIERLIKQMGEEEARIEAIQMMQSHLLTATESRAESS
tara:strand:- start:4010 stop:4705 length:696 start_codon:yes stop_codon:yes gene_type:complete